MKATPLPGILMAGGTRDRCVAFPKKQNIVVAYSSLLSLFRGRYGAETFPELFPSGCESWQDLGKWVPTTLILLHYQASFD